MSIIELLLIAIGLSMDAFAVSVGKGLTLKRTQLSHYLKVGLWFGGFQALMPLIGYLFCVSFSTYINFFDHWIAFILLAIIGANMIRESFSKEEDEDSSSDFSVKTMFIMAVATSIDALAMGVSFALMNVNIFTAISLIGITTFLFSAIGLKIGHVFGVKYKSKAEFTGGLILILIGTKILIEHLCE